MTIAVGAFDVAGGWDVDGDTSMTAWLRHHGAMTSRNAAVTSRTARRLRAAPVTAAAWVDGALSGGQVAAVCANVTDTTAALWAEHEADVVPTLVPLPVADVAAAMGVWRARAEATTDPAPPGEPERTLRCSRTLNGRGEVSGSLDAEAADIVATALQVGTSDDIPAPLVNALVVRDTHCRWPGCDRSPTWCEGHHVTHWEHGGPTRPDNLVLLCSRHHHRAHQPGWHVKLLPDATVETTGPDGTHHTSRPPPRC